MANHRHASNRKLAVGRPEEASIRPHPSRGRRLALVVVAVLTVFAFGCGSDKEGAEPMAATPHAVRPSPSQTDRPILFYDENDRGTFFTSSVVPGQSEIHDAQGANAVMSPDGSKVIIQTDWGKAAIVTPNGEGIAPVNATKSGKLLYGPAWSPDGGHVAMLVTERKGNGLVIADSSTGETSYQTLPRSLFSAWPTAGVDTFRWSPTGNQILVSWEETAVVDTDTGQVQSLPTDGTPEDFTGRRPVIATWSPDGRSILFLRVWRGDNTLTGLYRWPVGSAKSEILADRKALAAAGMTPQDLNFGQMTLAPDGSKIAVALQGHVLVFEVAADGSMDVSQPVADIPSDPIVSRLEWSPDSGALAALRIDRPSGTSVDHVALGSKEWDELAVPGFKIKGTEGLDATGMTKMLSWTT